MIAIAEITMRKAFESEAVKSYRVVSAEAAETFEFDLRGCQGYVLLLIDAANMLPDDTCTLTFERGLAPGGRALPPVSITAEKNNYILLSTAGLMQADGKARFRLEGSNNRGLLGLALDLAVVRTRLVPNN